MLLGFPERQKVPTDVIIVTLDWTPFVPEGTTALATRAVSTEGGDVVAANVAATDLAQKISLSAGSENSYTFIKARITVAGGTDITRAFICRVM